MSLLANADQLSSQEVQRQYEELLEEMSHNVPLTAPLQQMSATFLKVTKSYQQGLFHCYDVADLPHTNNDLEHVFGSTRYHEDVMVPAPSGTADVAAETSSEPSEPIEVTKVPVSVTEDPWVGAIAVQAAQDVWAVFRQQLGPKKRGGRRA